MVTAVKIKENLQESVANSQARQRIIDGLFYSPFSDEVD